MSAGIGRIDDVHFKLGTLELKIEDDRVIILGLGMNNKTKKVWEYLVPDRDSGMFRMLPTSDTWNDIEKKRDKLRKEAVEWAMDIIESFE